MSLTEIALYIVTATLQQRSLCGVSTISSMARCVNIGTSYGTFSLPEAQNSKKIGRGPERRPLLEGARMRHQRPCRYPLRLERAALALWAMPVHASSDGVDDDRRHPSILAVYDDAAGLR